MISTEAARYYLAALIDGEGTINGNQVSREVAIYNTESSILDFAEECLNLLEIPYKRYAPTSRHPCQEIRFSNREQLLLIADLPLQSSAKKNKLNDVLNSYKTSLEYYRSREWKC